MIVAEPQRRTLNGTTQAGPDLERAIRDYVRAYVRRHGRRKTAGDLGVSRHTLWRFLERGHVGRAVPSAVLNAVGGNTAALEAATLEIIIDLEGLRPDPALRPLPKGLEEALLLLCATPLATVDELTRFGRVPASTLRDRLEKLSKRCLVDSMAYHLSVLGARPQRRYFPTEKGVTAGGAATKGRAHMLRAYPVSKQWFRLLAERLDAVAVLYRVAALVADSDPHNDPVRVDHYRQGPYDMLLTLSGGRSIGLLRQGPVLPTSNLRYRLRSIKRLHSSETPFVTFVLTHADQATRRAIRSLGDPSEHRRTFVATEGETLAGDAKAVVWQQSGSGLGDDPPVRVSPVASLPGRKLMQRSTSLRAFSPANSSRNSTGAVTTRAFIWLMACVRAFIAESLTILSTRIISTLSTPDLGDSRATPARTDHAAISASRGSLLPSIRRVDLSGRLTSITLWPHRARCRASPAPYEPVPSTPKVATWPRPIAQVSRSS